MDILISIIAVLVLVIIALVVINIERKEHKTHLTQSELEKRISEQYQVVADLQKLLNKKESVRHSFEVEYAELQQLAILYIANFPRTIPRLIADNIDDKDLDTLEK